MLAGIATEFGDKAEAVPEGTKVHWAFGDGTEAEGPVVSHAFGRAGEYTVVESVVDSSGTRTASSAVSVDRRSAWMAVPPGVRSALVLDRFLNRLPRLVAFLKALSSAERVDSMFSQIAAAIGFDPRIPEEVVKAGVDADKGVAWVNFEEEPNTNYFVVGVYDPGLADDTLRKAFVTAGATFTAGPDGWSIATLSNQGYHFRFDRGFLIVRLPNDEKPEPPLALGTFAAAPDVGMLTDASFGNLRGVGEAGDAEYLLARSAIVSPDAKPSANPIAARVNAGVQRALISVEAKGQELIALGHLEMSAEGSAAAASLFGGSTTSTLPARAPPQAAGYASFSGDVPGLLDLIAGAPSPGGSTSQGIAELLGGHDANLQVLLGLMASDAAVAAYFDPGEFFRSLMETHNPVPRGDVLLGVSTRGSSPALATLETALAASHTPFEKQALPLGTGLTFALDGHPAGAVVDAHSVTLSYGAHALDRMCKLGPKDARLETELRAALPPDAFAPGRLVAYVNVARLREQLSGDAANVPGLSATEMFQAQLMAQMAVSQFASIRDLGLIVKPAPSGLEAWLRLRLQ